MNILNGPLKNGSEKIWKGKWSLSEDPGRPERRPWPKRYAEGQECDVKTRYLTWDGAEDRENIIRERFPTGPGLLILDEIHKYSRWRQIVKGLFDKRGAKLKIMVTGSARLDYYRRGGDSLQGRYHFFKWCFFLQILKAGKWNCGISETSTGEKWIL